MVRSVLVVRINKCEQPGVRNSNACVPRNCKTLIVLPNVRDATLGVCNRQDEIFRAVFTSVVHHDELPVSVFLVENRSNRTSDERFSVEGGEYYRDRWLNSLVHIWQPEVDWIEEQETKFLLKRKGPEILSDVSKRAKKRIY